MRKEIIINSNPHEIRIAILEDGDLVEMLIERADAKRIVGNIYRGIVTSVKPGLQAAFIDIGMERAGFLHASDLIHEEPDSADSVDGPGPPRRGRGRAPRVPDIGTMLKTGDELLVQVTKEPISTKGPRLTADISLPGRFLVHMPKGTHVGVSRKIEDRRERVRLKNILQESRPDTGAFIIRTAASGVEDKQIRNDVKYLSNLTQQINDADKEIKPPCLVHEDVGMVVGLIRDIFKDDIHELVIDDKDDYQRLMKYVKIFAPELNKRIRLYKDSLAIFEHYGVEQELRKSTENRVWLKRGGYIIIEQTEALVSVDVNTGRFTGRRNQEETIIETNLLAAREVARQLRLRDIGGIIVIDFIDMENENNKKRLMNELRNALRVDRARYKVFPVSGLGLVEMSRQRVRPSLVSFLSDDCPYCKGDGKVLSLATMANRVEREVHRVFHNIGEKSIQIQANPLLAMYIMQDRVEQIDELCSEHNITIDILDDPTLHREEFKVVSLRNDRNLIQEADKKGRKRLPPSVKKVDKRNTRSEKPGEDKDKDKDQDKQRPATRPRRSRGGRSRGRRGGGGGSGGGSTNRQPTN
jgi:ribonuclease G